MLEEVKIMAGLSFKCSDLGFACNFEVKGVNTREEMVEIIKSHGRDVMTFRQLLQK